MKTSFGVRARTAAREFTGPSPAWKGVIDQPAAPILSRSDRTRRSDDHRPGTGCRAGPHTKDGAAIAEQAQAGFSSFVTDIRKVETACLAMRTAAVRKWSEREDLNLRPL